MTEAQNELLESLRYDRRCAAHAARKFEIEADRDNAAYYQDRVAALDKAIRAISE